jgi:hypothetical protein
MVSTAPGRSFSPRLRTRIVELKSSNRRFSDPPTAVFRPLAVFISHP